MHSECIPQREDILPQRYASQQGMGTFLKFEPSTQQKLTRAKAPRTRSKSRRNENFNRDLSNVKTVVQGADLSPFKEIKDFRNMEHKEVEDLKKKLNVVYKDKKKKEREVQRLESQIENLEDSLESSKKFLKLMKEEMEHVHCQNKILLDEKRELEEYIYRFEKERLKDKDYFTGY